jgi:hypothetical protein
MTLGMIGPHLGLPGPDNDWQTGHVARLAETFARATGRDLVAEMALDPSRLGQSAWEGNFALLSHRGDANTTLNYANRFALDLWECDWATLTAMSSEATAPNGDIAERAAMMAIVARQGHVSGYNGRRISAKGRLFVIENTTIWKLLDASGEQFGAAAAFKSFKRL